MAATVNYYPVPTGGSITVTTGTGLSGSGTVADPLVFNPATGNIPGPWTVSTVTGAAVTDITISGLTGETDGGYEVYIELLAASGTPNYTVQPNGLTTNQVWIADYNNGAAGTVSPLSRTSLYIGFGGRSAAASCRGTFTITSKTGAYRALQVHTHSGVGTGIATDQQFVGAGEWQETATAITSLVIHSDVASGIAIGSFIMWRKLFRLI